MATSKGIDQNNRFLKGNIIYNWMSMFYAPSPPSSNHRKQGSQFVSVTAVSQLESISQLPHATCDIRCLGPVC